MSEQAVVVERDVPPAGTACRQCRAQGHFCPAREYDDVGDPLCICCAHGEECATAKIVRSLDSPTAEVVDLGGTPPAPVRSVDPATVTVTPVPDDPEHRRNEDKWRAQRAEANRMMRDVEARRSGVTSRKVRAREVGKVIMSPHVVMGAEMLDPDARNRVEKVKEEEPVKDAVEKKKCAMEGCTENASPRGSYCSKKHYSMLRAELDGKPAPKARANEQITQKLPAAVQPPKSKEALPGISSASPSVVVELSEQEALEIFRSFSPLQKSHALAAGWGL